MDTESPPRDRARSGVSTTNLDARHFAEVVAELRPYSDDAPRYLDLYFLSMPGGPVFYVGRSKSAPVRYKDHVRRLAGTKYEGFEMRAIRHSADTVKRYERAAIRILQPEANTHGVDNCTKPPTRRHRMDFRCLVRDLADLVADIRP